MRKEVIKKRQEIISGLFPEGIPSLWCPMIVHYTPERQIDLDHMEMHMRFMVPYVKSFLLFGSAGDGWELDSSEKELLLRACIEWSKRYGIRMLLGVLQPETGECRREIAKWQEWLKAFAHTQDTAQALHNCGVVGFTVCAPRGADLSQQTIQDGLESILQMNLPVAIYQLPQMTQNEIAPETLSLLAEKYPNFYLFKDTSGTDRSLLSDLDFGGVFFLRGMEGAYFDWFTGSKARYPGFLLSSANCFASTLMRMLSAARAGDVALAKSCSDQVQGIIDAVLKNTAGLAGGNVFANTNKCLEHCLAYGPQWMKAALPMRHCGDIIPVSYVSFSAQILEDYGFMPEKGYMQE